MENQSIRLSVGEFIALTNQTLEYAYPSIEVEGEVASFKVNQGKFVFFDLKDSEGSVGCFMMVFSLRIPIEDGMKVIVRANPKLTKWGKFSLTVQSIRPSGEGSLKKSFELLKAKLDSEGLFAQDRKRLLPNMPKKIAIISSVQAAGYADFVKILGDRWGNIEIDVASVQVQGEVAADQIIRAINYFNEQEELADVLLVIRGGGSADDLSTFNDEKLVRTLGASRIPTLTGIGHEVDESLCDLVADLAAATPSNAAQLLVPDRRDIIHRTKQSLRHMMQRTEQRADMRIVENNRILLRSLEKIEHRLDLLRIEYEQHVDLLEAYNPKRVLDRGYALVRGKVEVGKTLEIETSEHTIKTEVTHVTTK